MPISLFSDRELQLLRLMVLEYKNRVHRHPPRHPEPEDPVVQDIPFLEVVNFELKQAVVFQTENVADAYRRNWDSSLNDGWGGFVTDCDDVIQVADLNGEGHEAGVGGRGKAHMYDSDNGPIGVIFDLCCPGDEQPTCP